jgi:endonuclease/exonuclease/phosphatase family metal-dependent hydrolase
MKLRFITFVIGLYGLSLFGQTRIKAMTYNLMHYPGTLYYDNDSNTFVDRTPILDMIIDSYQPDLLMVCELKNSIGSNQILNDALQTTDNRYEAATFTYNQSSTYQDLQQMIYFNKQKLILDNQGIITTYLRDINHYTFILNTTDHITNPIFLEVFVTHLKASQGTDNEGKRLQMVQEFTSFIEGLPSDRYIIFSGDLNFYYANEPGYQELINPSNNIHLIDPINREGYWHNNSSFADIHTQSPLTSNSHFQSESGGSDGVTGGLDDRFDFMLISGNLQNGTDLTYVPDTYKAYGNNGNCFNDNINDPNCNGDFSQELRDLLYNMSDHLPIVMELETPEAIGYSDYTYTNNIEFNGANYTSSNLSLNITPKLLGSDIIIYNQIGQQAAQFKLTSVSQEISVIHLSHGVYYIINEQFPQHSPLKFIKL